MQSGRPKHHKEDSVPDAKKKEDTARNKKQQTASRANRSEAQKEEDRASNAMGMAALRGDENHRLKENNRERLRKKDWRKVPKNWEKEKTCQNERRADGTSDLDKIKDLTRGDLTTRLWKRPGFDWHTENHEQHWQAAVMKLYLCAGIGWDEEFRWEVAFIHVYNRLESKIKTSESAIERVKEIQEQCERGEISKEEKLARFVFIAYDAGGKEERDEMESVLKNIFGLTKVGRLLLCMQLPEGHGDRAKCQSDLAGWFKDDVAFGQMEELCCTFVPRHTEVIGVLRPKLHKLCSLHFVAIECKVPFDQVCIQPFENKHREEAIEYQRANAERPLLLGVLPFEEAFLEWFVEKGPDDLIALKEKFEKLYLEEKKERMKKLADTHIKVTMPHCMLKGQDKDLTLLEDLREKQAMMGNLVGLKLNVPQHVLFGQDKNLVLLEDLRGEAGGDGQHDWNPVEGARTLVQEAKHGQTMEFIHETVEVHRHRCRLAQCKRQ